jgi:hypothetical protein
MHERQIMKNIYLLDEKTLDIGQKYLLSAYSKEEIETTQDMDQAIEMANDDNAVVVVE